VKITIFFSIIYKYKYICNSIHNDMFYKN
ncbi:hypothetical protein, partial [Plasmodium yoelii yoelii]